MSEINCANHGKSYYVVCGRCHEEDLKLKDEQHLRISKMLSNDVKAWSSKSMSLESELQTVKEKLKEALKCIEALAKNGVSLEDQLREAVEVNDMQAAMIEGMRGVVAMARLVNSDREDIRLALAIRDYDKCKIVTASGSGNGKIAPVKQ